MCGIAGVLNLRGEAVEAADLAVFTRLLAHRGPDGSGTWQRGSVGLAHTRLAIIDLTTDAAQPMSNEDGTVWLTYNGEVYNYAELRRELIEKGHRFRSQSDTEVIIHLYEEEGVECLKRLRGMFAFGLWDEARGRLLLARDRVGEKPLYYAVHNGRVVFASELKAIAAFPGLERTIDTRSLLHVFSYHYVPWPMSIYENIHKLPPASYVTFGPPGGGEVRKYWELDLAVRSSLSEEEAVDRLTELVKESVTLRLRSDVPLGMFLSGGVDSSFIVGTAARLVPNRIQTFSIGYQDAARQDPEFSFSRLVSEYFDTCHQEIIFNPDLIEFLPELMWHYDEPFCIPNALPYYQMCREARKSVTVVLSGDGGDEIFGGYDIYKKWKLVDLVSWLLPLGRLNGQRGAARKFNGAPLWWVLWRTPPAGRRGAQKQHFSQGAVAPLFKREVWQELEAIDVGEIVTSLYESNHPRDFINGILFTDLLLTYSWATTVVADISGMSNGLEVRAPFLDHKLVEFVFSLPSRLKIKGFRQEKYLLYQAGRRFLPQAVTDRKKMPYGAGIPFGMWFSGAWRGFVEDMLLGGPLDDVGLFDMKAVKRLYNEQDVSSASKFRLLWKLLCVACWWQSQKALPAMGDAALRTQDQASVRA